MNELKRSPDYSQEESVHFKRKKFKLYKLMQTIREGRGNSNRKLGKGNQSHKKRD